MERGGIMKKVKVVLIVLVLLVTSVFLITTSISRSMASEIVIEDIELSKIKDGKYIGQHITKIVTAKVEVEVVGNSIKNITILEHKCGTGYTAEVIVDEIIKNQSVNVDVISGATLSSAVIKKAVMNALEVKK